jgi:hypothetical protein
MPDSAIGVSLDADEQLENGMVSLRYTLQRSVTAPQRLQG